MDLGISSGNDYKLRASLCSSKDIFAKEIKSKQDGSIDRVQKKDSPAMGDFFTF